MRALAVLVVPFVVSGCGLVGAVVGEAKRANEPTTLEQNAARSNEAWNGFAASRSEKTAETAATSQLHLIETARYHCEEKHDDSVCDSIPRTVAQAKTRLSEIVDWGVANGKADDQVFWSAMATESMFEHGGGVLKDEWFTAIAERRVVDLAGAIQQAGSLEKAANDRQQTMCLFTSDPPAKGATRKAKVIFDRADPRVYVHCAFPQPLSSYARSRPDAASVDLYSIHNYMDSMESSDATVWSIGNSGNLGKGSSIDFEVPMETLQSGVQERMADQEYRGKWQLMRLSYVVAERTGQHVDGNQIVNDYATNNLIRTFFLVRMRP